MSVPSSPQGGSTLLRPVAGQQRPGFTRAISSSNALNATRHRSHSSASTSGAVLGSGAPGASQVPGSPSKSKRARSSSIVSVTEIKENYDDVLDQGALYNVNASWVNYKGAWLVHVVLLFFAKMIFDTIPGIRQDYSWTLLNIGYCIVSYIIFHYVTGSPDDVGSNSGVYDRLTLWEQIDNGAQHTPVKKWLTTLPIVVFLAATHYTRFDSHPALFTLNLTTLSIVGLLPKLPYFHRIRIRFFDGGVTPDPSGPPTPTGDKRSEPDFTHFPPVPE